MKKVLSIIVPVYNTERYIERCLTSLLMDQEINKDLEIIIVNDGSIDGSLSIMKDFQKKYPKTVVVVNKENGGHGSTINAGLEVATGKYLRVVDSDDWVNVIDFPLYVKKLKEVDSDIILTDFRRDFAYTGDSILYSYAHALTCNHEYDLDTFDVSKLKDDYFYMATTTYKTELLRRANLHLDEKTFYVDMEYILLPIPFIKTFTYFDYDVYRYFIGRSDQSVSNDGMVRNRRHHEKVVKRLVVFYSKLDTSDSKKEYIAKVLKLLLRTHYFIFCTMPVGKKGRNDIVAFDRFLRRTSKDLYKRSNHGFIKWNRRTRFIFSQSFKRVFSKIIVVME